MLTKGRSGLIYQTKKLEHSLEIFFNSFMLDSALEGNKARGWHQVTFYILCLTFVVRGHRTTEEREKKLEKRPIAQIGRLVRIVQSGW